MVSTCIIKGLNNDLSRAEAAKTVRRMVLILKPQAYLRVEFSIHNSCTFLDHQSLEMVTNKNLNQGEIV